MSKEAIEEIAKKNYAVDGFFNSYEFRKDIRNLFIIKKMVNRFIETGVMNEKLLVNNIIISCNTFGITAANILLRKAVYLDDHWAVVKSILIFLSSYNLQNDSIEPNRVVSDILADSKNRVSLTA